MTQTSDHSLQGQLEQVRSAMNIPCEHSDQSDIDLSFQSDAWKEQHLKLMQNPMRIDGAD